MPHRSLTSYCSPSLRLSTSPVALNTWPLVMSPTGTVIDSPVSITLAPRTRPSVDCIEIARTMPSPMCRATSRISFLVSPPSSSSTSSLLYISGIASVGNSTSTTGPVTRATRPVLPARALLGPFNSGSHISHSFPALASASAFTPPTISLISWVMPAWRAWLAMRVYFLISSSALCRGLHRLLTGGQLGGGRLQQAKKIRLWTYLGSSASRTSAGDGSNS